ncbi:MAG: hypothetical protein A4E29_00936 [Methanomassiliicoccales archaeon PtaB.Bin134]|nr:MAG: hypothetical protein A4E29_00936 [Methanomassiliicoccales archaeon PtaB.Bin134]
MYTAAVHTARNTIRERSFMRSATPPMIRATVIMANMPWYIMNSRWGTVGARLFGSMSTPFSMRCPAPPIRP